VRHGAKQIIWTCPRARFLKDLSQEVTQWTVDSEEVIVLADMNKDVKLKILLSFARR